MDSIQFCYWLQGFFEISKADCLTTEQIEIIKKHLSSVFTGEILNGNPSIIFDTLLKPPPNEFGGGGKVC